MTLPNFDTFRTVRVEKTKSSHGHGGSGWEFGTCLWSPTTDKSGKHIYKNMRAAQDGDLVLHFYEDAPYGKQTDHYFCGISAVAGAVEIRNDQPPLPGEWAGQSQYYRLVLRGFSPLTEALPLRKFVQQYDAQIAATLKKQTDQPFINYNGNVRLAQGKYLSRCGRELYELLSNAINEQIVLNATTQKTAPTETKGQPTKTSQFDYEEYVEGQRAKREAWFFSRNPRLVRDAKDHYDYQCQACLFRYEKQYPMIGKDFIEVHHLNPLSERENAAADHRLTSLSQVTALCANCHRMVHRLIRKLGRSVSVQEFQSYIRSNTI